jgi:uncharacterized membrane protein YqaE (UPF0057 family)
VAEFLTLAFGLLVPPLVSFLKDCAMPDALKILLTLLASLAGGFAIVALTGDPDWRNIAGWSTAVFTAATTFYHAYFKNTLLNENLEERKVL